MMISHKSCEQLHSTRSYEAAAEKQLSALLLSARMAGQVAERLTCYSTGSHHRERIREREEKMITIMNTLQLHWSMFRTKSGGKKTHLFLHYVVKYSGPFSALNALFIVALVDKVKEEWGLLHPSIHIYLFFYILISYDAKAVNTLNHMHSDTQQHSSRHTYHSPPPPMCTCAFGK